MAATLSAKSLVPRSSIEMLMETGSTIPRWRHRVIWTSTAPITHSVRGRTSAVRSASGTNSAGEIGPNSGWVQRSNASAPMQASVRRSTLGW